MTRGPTAHDAVSHATEQLVERARAAAYRLICARPDADAVHDFRVSLRRLRTVVRASRALHGKKKVKPFEEGLKRFGDATSALRDAEVLGETLDLAMLDDSARRAADRWLAERRSDEFELREAAVALVRGQELEEIFAALSTAIVGTPKRDVPLPAFADDRIADAQTGVAELLPVAGDDAARLHRLRIRFKRLRYVAEMLGELAGELDRAAAKPLRSRLDELTRQSARMQKLLGQLHDADQALMTLGDSRELELVEQGPLRAALVALRERLVVRALEALATLPPSVLPAAERLLPSKSAQER
jgi:CHAD domain-containing protein